jgi:hypothetical protein
MCVILGLFGFGLPQPVSRSHQVEMTKKQKVEMTADAETLARSGSAGDVISTVTDSAMTTTAASATASAPVNVAAVRDLEALTSAVAHVDAETLLAIITELRATAGVSTCAHF